MIKSLIFFAVSLTLLKLSVARLVYINASNSSQPMYIAQNNNGSGQGLVLYRGSTGDAPYPLGKSADFVVMRSGSDLFAINWYDGDVVKMSQSVGMDSPPTRIAKKIMVCGNRIVYVEENQDANGVTYPMYSSFPRNPQPQPVMIEKDVGSSGGPIFCTADY